MQWIRYKIFFTTLLMIVLPCVAMADLITPGQKTIDVRSTIENPGDFPDYEFLANLKCPSGSRPFWITADTILEVGYKLCRYEIYAVEKQFKDKILDFSYQYSLLTQEDLDRMPERLKTDVSRIWNFTQSGRYRPYYEDSKSFKEDQKDYALRLALFNEYNIYEVNADLRVGISTSISDPRQEVEEVYRIVKSEEGFVATRISSDTTASVAMSVFFYLVPLISLGVMIYLFYRWRKA